MINNEDKFKYRKLNDKKDFPKIKTIPKNQENPRVLENLSYLHLLR